MRHKAANILLCILASYNRHSKNSLKPPPPGGQCFLGGGRVLSKYGPGSGMQWRSMPGKEPRTSLVGHCLNSICAAHPCSPMFWSSSATGSPHGADHRVWVDANCRVIPGLIATHRAPRVTIAAVAIEGVCVVVIVMSCNSCRKDCSATREFWRRISAALQGFGCTLADMCHQSTAEAPSV